MRSFKFAFTTAVVIASVALPGLSQATSTDHTTNTDASFAYHPDHATGSKARANVLAELDAARKDGTLVLIQRCAPVPIESTTPAKTRQQVISEILDESPEARQVRLESTDR